MSLQIRRSVRRYCKRSARAAELRALRVEVEREFDAIRAEYSHLYG